MIEKSLHRRRTVPRLPDLHVTGLTIEQFNGIDRRIDQLVLSAAHEPFVERMSYVMELEVAPASCSTAAWSRSTTRFWERRERVGQATRSKPG